MPAVSIKAKPKAAAPKTAASGAARVAAPEPPQKQFGNRAIASIIQRKCACGGASDEPCDACRDRSQLQTMQRQARVPGGPIAVSPSSLHTRLGTGSPLPAPVRAHFETGFGRDLSGVRVHSGPRAAELAREFNALAFTLGSDIAFAPGRYNPASQEGRRLLAHELAHVIQQSAAAPSAIAASYDALEREADYAAAQIVTSQAPAPALSAAAPGVVQAIPDPDPTGLGDVPMMRMSADFSGLYFVPPAEAMFNLETSFVRQVVSAILSRLLGPEYVPGELEDAAIEKFSLRLTGYFEDGSVEAEAKEKNRQIGMGDWRFDAEISLAFLEWLRSEEAGSRSVDILPAQEEVLTLGQVLPDLYGYLNAAANESSAGPLPAWYSEAVFSHDIAFFGTLLRAFHTAYESDTWEGTDLSAGAAAKLLEAVAPAIRAMEAIRTDPDLFAMPEYNLMWNRSAEDAGDPPGAASEEADIGRAGRTALGFIRTQTVQLEKATLDDDDGKAARKELLERFANFYQRVPLSHSGDLMLADKPPKYNTPPLRATLSAFPAVEPPFYDASMAGEMAFTMSLQVSDFAEAWASLSYIYRFEQISIPPERYRGTATEMEKQVTFSRWANYKKRLARDTSYNAADVRRIIGRQVAILGDPGTTVGLATMNSLLRYTGTTVHTIIEGWFDPNYVARFTFEDEGLYMIRCIAAANAPEDAAVLRPASIAWLPVFAVDPLIMAERRLEMELSIEEKNKDRLAEIDELLKANPTDKDLLDEKTRLEQQATVEGALALARDDLQDMLDSGTLSESEKEPIEKRLEQIKQIIEVRGKRSLDGAFRVPAVFVADNPPRATHLLLEAVDESPSDWPNTKRKIYLSDSTTPNSGDTRCEIELTAAEIADNESAMRLAVLCAVKKLLESDMGYGRGYVSVVVDGGSASERIDADDVQILLEGVTNIAMVASIAAIAAAPFTGGATLVLLVPIGVIGAIPSAYRIASRAEAGTLRWDMATAMDLVNVASAFVGLGAEAAAARQAFKLGGAMLITGFGLDGLNVILMGVDLVSQLESLKDLPPEFRAAHAAEIIGNAMLNAGIMVGGTLAAKVRGKEFASKEKSLAQWKEELPAKTQEMLAEPGVLAKFSEMPARIRDLLTHCSDFCIPKFVTEEQVGRIKDLLEKYAATPDDELALRRFFDDQIPKEGAEAATQIDKINDALKQLEGHADAAALRSFLEQKVPIPDRVLGSFPELRKDPDLRDLVTKLTDPAQGGISVLQLALIMDHCKQRGTGARRVLGYLDKLSTGKKPGWEHVVGDLSKGYGFFVGAEWVLRWIDGSGKWDDVEQFERQIENEEGTVLRRWDCIIGGDVYQFKNWSTFWQKTFLKQINQDYNITNGFRSRDARWVFDTRIGTKADVDAHMRTALKAAADAQDDRFPQAKRDAIQDYLDSMIIVGVTPP